MSADAPEGGWLTVNEAAAHYRVSVRNVRRRMAAGRIATARDAQGRTLLDTRDLARVYLWRTYADAVLREQAEEIAAREVRRDTHDDDHDEHDDHDDHDEGTDR